MTTDTKAHIAWGALQVHGYSPTALAGMLDLETVDLDDPAHQQAVLRLADRMACTWGDDQDAAAAARAAGFHPIGAYDEQWRLDTCAIPGTPENDAATLAGRRWEIVRRMAEGLPTHLALDGHEDAWCARTMQRFRAEHMTTAESRYEAFHYQPDDKWMRLADEAVDNPVGAALRHGLMRHQDLPDGHPAKVAVAEQQLRRRREGRRRPAAAVGEQTALEFAV